MTNAQQATMQLPRLLQLDLSRPEGGSFWALHYEAVPRANRAVMFLHGLGENRSGLNYIFRELAEYVQALGWATYRFDLAGCGESTFPLDLRIWEAQVHAVRQVASHHSRIAIVCRGAGCCAVPEDWPHGPVIALAPAQSVLYEEGLASIREGAPDGWTRPQQGLLTEAEHRFWTNLGVEAGCIGGLVVPLAFLEQVGAAFRQPRRGWNQVFPEALADLAPASSKVLLKAAPLFAFARDRSGLAGLLEKFLEEAP